ncbi:transposase [Paraphaeosphaeria sporulosa]
MDETGVMLSMLGSTKVLVSRSDMRNYRGARVKREAVTAIECISADGRFLNPMIIWPASTHRSNWTTFETPGWQYALSDSGYTDSYISLQWLQRFNCFGTHETLEILEFCLVNNIILCRLPSHTSHKLQPCDVSTFAPLKAAYRDQVERLERGGVNKIGKEHFTALYSPARVKAFTPKNIKAGFAACGLFPFNPERVLRSMPKPPDPEVDNVMSGPCQLVRSDQRQDWAIQSPKTPVSAEGFNSLQNMIVQQNTHACDETGRWRLQRLIQKLGKAAQIAFAKGLLQHNHIRFLMKINDEAKVRRSTKPIVLGTARIMSYEDLVDARVKRAEKDAAKEAKGQGKRGRKRKTVAPETEAEAGPAEPTVKKTRTSEVLESEQQRVTVARMY